MQRDKLKYYFTEFEFLHDRILFGPADDFKRNVWTAVTYLMTSLGIFAHQITSYPKVAMNMLNFNLSSFVASLILGFAILPVVARRISKDHPKLSLLHLSAAFALGFFADFTSKQVTEIVRNLY